MSNDPNAFTSILSSLELGDEPVNLAERIVLLGVSVEVEVHGVTEVVVKGDDAEAGVGADGVGTIVLDRVNSIGRQPA